MSTLGISDQADADSSAPFVLDFLYHDSRRIGSFLSQFEEDGHLQQFTRTKNGSRSKRENSRREGGANFGVAAGKMESSAEVSLGITESYARVFDPYWANARAFLNYISDLDMLNGEILNGEIGQFVIIKGYLSILDLAMMKQAWSLPAIQKKILGESKPHKPVSQMTTAEKNAYKDAQKEERDNKELTLELMQILPHAIHASLIVDENPAALVWGSLLEEYLVVPASEVTLAHGGKLPGTWTIVGILTAKPEWLVPNLNESMDAESVGMLTSMVGQVSQHLAPIVRFALGRPAAAYAVTPLLIFREVA